MKQKCRPELRPFYFSRTGSKTQTEPRPRLLFFKFHQMDPFCPILGFVYFFETGPRSLLFGCMEVRLGWVQLIPLIHNFITTTVYIHSSKREENSANTNIVLHSSFTILLTWKTRGEVADSLVAVVIVYNTFKGIRHQKNHSFPTVIQ